MGRGRALDVDHATLHLQGDRRRPSGAGDNASPGRDSAEDSAEDRERVWGARNLERDRDVRERRAHLKNTHIYSHTHTHTHTHTLSLSLTHTHTNTHKLTHSLTHPPTHSHTHTLTRPKTVGGSQPGEGRGRAGAARASGGRA